MPRHLTRFLLLYFLGDVMVLATGRAERFTGAVREARTSGANERDENDLYEEEEVERDVDYLSKEIELWMTYPEQNLDTMPPNLKEVVLMLNRSTADGSEMDSTERTLTGPHVYCGACNILAAIVIKYARLGGPVNIIANFLVKICYLIAYRSTSVCKGLIYQDKDRVNYIIRNSNVNSDQLCSMVLGSQGCGPYRGPSWSVSLPLKRDSRKQNFRYKSHDPSSGGGRYLPRLPSGRRPHVFRVPPVHRQKYGFPRVVPGRFKRPRLVLHFTPRLLPTEKSGHVSSKAGVPRVVLKVLHLTDPHYDPHYKAGTNAECEAPLCCNEASGYPRNPQDGAGIWGDYRNCDSPRKLIISMLDHIRDNHPDIDYIMCTGDLVPHYIWKSDRPSNEAVMKESAQIFQHYFPNTPVYGAIGNHESFPRDSFPPPEVPEVWSRFSVQWLYDLATENWSKLSGKELPKTSRFTASYAVTIRPGLKLISVNTNYCYRLNWWVLYKPQDPGLILHWLAGELHQAEINGEFVHIIGHIPPMYIDCYMPWAHQFNRIVSRFSHIIKGQFYGHSHMDEFRLHYNVDSPTEPVGVEYVTPNNGPFRSLNPSYRIYYVDGDYEGTTRDVLDYETWVMNLTHANLNNDPKWYLLYRARDDFHLPDLSPSSWDNLVQRMAKDPELFNQFHRYQVQDSDVALRKGCDFACRKSTLCSLVEGDRALPRKCSPDNR